MSELKVAMKPKYTIVWPTVLVFAVMHLAAIYVFYLRIFGGLKMNWYHMVLVVTMILGVTVGNHRLYSHKSFKASKGLEIFLLILSSSTYQRSCYNWARNHRLHHRHSETDADPHNSKRGFFFSHVGWLCVKKHPAVKEKGKLINMSDLEANPLVMFQDKYYGPLVALFTFILPTYIWHNLTGHSIFLSFLITLYRVVTTWHCTWGINSFSHLYGMKPYTKSAGASENLYVMATTLGEGFHNYHHTFPHDYRSNRGNYDIRTVGTVFIDLCKFLGLASDLKIVPQKTIRCWADQHGIKSDYNKAYTFMAYVKCYVVLFLTFGYLL